MPKYRITTKGAKVEFVGDDFQDRLQKLLKIEARRGYAGKYAVDREVHGEWCTILEGDNDKRGVESLLDESFTEAFRMEEVGEFPADQWVKSDGRLLLNFKAYAKMYHFTQAAPGEVSGIGFMVKQDNDFLVKDVMLLDQVSSGAHTELDEEATTDLLVKIAQKGGTPLDYMFWYHSHNNFGVGWSNTDEENIARHSQEHKYVSLCMNKFGDMVARSDLSGNRQDLAIVVLPTGHNRLMKKCYGQVVRKVKGHTWISEDKQD